MIATKRELLEELLRTRQDAAELLGHIEAYGREQFEAGRQSVRPYPVVSPRRAVDDLAYLREFAIRCLAGWSACAPHPYQMGILREMRAEIDLSEEELAVYREFQQWASDGVIPPRASGAP